MTLYILVDVNALKVLDVGWFISPQVAKDYWTKRMRGSNLRVFERVG